MREPTDRRYLPASTGVTAAAYLLLLALLAGCATGTDEPDDADGAGPVVVATTSILGDIAGSVIGEAGRVEVMMPRGVDPHGFRPSAADAAMLRSADLVLANGLQLEESLVSALDAAAGEGVRILALAEHLDPRPVGDDDHSDDDRDDHSDGHSDDHSDDDSDDHSDGHSDDHSDDGSDDHSDEHADDDPGARDDDEPHDHGPLDPHVWFDPVRMARGVELLAAELEEVTGAGGTDWRARGAAYADQLREVHDEVAGILATIPDERRRLITNHDALGYLAARYDLEIVATVLPGSSTQAEADAGGFARLIETVERTGIDVVFADTTDTTALADQLAEEVRARSGIELRIVGLDTGSLGEPGGAAGTYPDLLRSTATTIADALGGE